MPKVTQQVSKNRTEVQWSSHCIIHSFIPQSFSTQQIAGDSDILQQIQSLGRGLQYILVHHTEVENRENNKEIALRQALSQDQGSRGT